MTTLPPPILTTCHDCSVAPGNLHIAGCDVERCSFCGGQWIGCGHDEHEPEKEPWTGEWPGKAECRKFGWYSKLVPNGSGWGTWVRCTADDPDASEDLNRYAEYIMTLKAGHPTDVFFR